MRILKSVLLLSSYIALNNANLAIAETKILPPPEKLSEHVYAWIGPLDGPSKENHGYRMNLAFVVGTNAVAVIDTGYTETIAKEMLIHISKITDTPVKYAINTNSLPHRSMGNPVFRTAGAKIIAHTKTAKRMVAQSSNYAGIVERILELPEGTVKLLKKPDQTIEKATTLDLGRVKIILKPYNANHTPASLAVEVPADKMVYAGDILYAQRMLAVLPDSNIKSWIRVYDQLKQYKGATFIPGHGQPGPLKDFDFSTRSYLQLLLTHMDKMVEQGVDVQDAINKLDQSQYSRLANFELLAGRNASWAYLEREQAAFE